MEDSLESVRGLLKLGEHAVCAVDSCFAGYWHGGRMAAARRCFVGLSKNKKEVSVPGGQSLFFAHPPFPLANGRKMCILVTVTFFEMRMNEKWRIM